MGFKMNMNWRTKINGQEYASVAAMPEDIRQTYLYAMKAVEAGDAAPGDALEEVTANAPARPRIGRTAASPRGPRPIAPESFSTRKLVAGAVIAALLAVLYLLLARG